MKCKMCNKYLLYAQLPIHNRKSPGLYHTECIIDVKMKELAEKADREIKDALVGKVENE